MGRPDDAASPLSIRLFGPFEVHLGGRLFPRLSFRRSRSILALLALRQGREVERDWLTGLLWPDSSQAAGQHGLRNCLTDLRSALGPEAARLRSPTSRTLGLDLTGAFVDVAAFDAALARGDPEALEEVVSLYQGPLLEGCAEEWVFQERQVREQAYLAARETLAAHALARGDPAGAERHLRAALAADPLREQTQRALMEVLAAHGNYAAALVAYRELRLRLHREANAEPDPETRAKAVPGARCPVPSPEPGTGHRAPGTEAKRPGSPAAGRNGRHLPAPPAALELASGKQEHGAERGPAPESLVALCSNGAGTLPLVELPAEALPKTAAFPHNLPLQLTSFIGREQEIAQVSELLGSLSHRGHREHRVRETEEATGFPGASLSVPSVSSVAKTFPASRLVTLTGAGGCGKTRLALEVAVGLTPAYTDGVWFVELASLAEPARVPQSVAAALGIHEQPGPACGVCPPLIETLVEALKPKQLLLLLDNCEHLVDACAHLAQILLQSCPRLCILTTSREPLAIAGEQPYRVPSMLQAESVRLFIERAMVAQPALVLTAENAAAVEQICCRLDGIPLAIELAAARLKALPVETLRDRLQDMFALLTGGSRTALPRHQTLRALINWSHDLLRPDEQTLLRRLSVFAGGCTLEAAEAVCGEVLDLLTQLVAKSLILYGEQEGEGRYRLLEMIREYAREKLAASGETEALRERHARFFLALAETAEPELQRAEAGRWLDRLDREHDNLRAALAWSIGTDSPELGLRLAEALAEFWHPRGYLREGSEQLQHLLAHPAVAAPTAARARVLRTAGTFAGHPKDARALYEESLAIWRRLEDRAGIAAVLLNLGYLACGQWDWATARALAEESLAIRREFGDRRMIADALMLLSEILREDIDLPAARALAEENVALWRQLDDPVRIARGLFDLACVARDQGDRHAACAIFEESLVAARALGDRVRIGCATLGLGGVLLELDAFPAARALLEESLSVWRELDHKGGLVEVLWDLGETVRAQGDSAGAYGIFQEMLAVSREVDRSNYVARSLVFLGATAGDLGRWEEAAACCAEGLRLGRSGDTRGDRAHVAWGLAGLARAALAAGSSTWAARLLGGTARWWAGCCISGWRREFDRHVSAARAQMEAAEFEAAWAAGRAAPLEQIIAEALEEAPAG